MTDLMGISGLLNEPLYSGSSVTDLVPGLLPVAIGGRPYAIDPRQSERNILPRLRDAQDTEATPGEASLSTRGLWHRIQRSWERGAGQRLFDSSDKQSDRLRFWDSRGVDIWTDSQLSLLPEATARAEPGTPLSDPHLLSINDQLYVSSTSNLYLVNDPSSDSPTWDVVTGSTGFILGMVTDGYYVYVGTGVGIYRGVTGGGSVSVLGAGTLGTFGGLFYGNGRLLLTQANVLNEVDAAGALTAVTGGTHRNTNFRWTIFSSSPEWIYAGGNQTTRTELYRIGVDEATGALTAPVVAMSLPEGEFLNVLMYYTGTFWLGTSRGLRKAVADQRGNLQYSKVIADPGNVKCLCADGGYIWFGWSNFDDTFSGIGRAHAGEEVEDLVPVYASDLMAEVGFFTETTQVARCDDQTFFTANNNLYGPAEDGSLHPDGYIDMGWIDYGLSYAKTLIDTDLRHAPLAGRITVAVQDELDEETLYGGTLVAGSSGPSGPITMSADRFERFRLILYLERDETDPETGPTLYRWVLRAKPAPASQDEIVLALLLNTQVSAGWDGNQPWEQDTWAEFQALRRMASTRIPQMYQHGDRAELVTVEDVRMRPNAQNEEVETDLFFEGTCLVTLHTLEPT